MFAVVTGGRHGGRRATWTEKGERFRSTQWSVIGTPPALENVSHLGPGTDDLDHTDHADRTDHIDRIDPIAHTDNLQWWIL